MRYEALSVIFLSFFISASERSMERKLSSNETEQTGIKFKNIDHILKSDMLEKEVVKKKKIIEKVAREKKYKKMVKYDIPPKERFWTFFSEYWIVKNAVKLKWDFEKPDYGLDVSFAFFLEKLGIYEKKFNILLIDSPSITHTALPSDKDELIFILSLPFIRTLNLSKLEISLILFEDYLRMKAGYFNKFIMDEKLEKYIGGNFHERKGKNKKMMEILLKKYDMLIYEKGYSFQEQYQVTKQMEQFLKSNIKLKDVYLSLLEKIDHLVKSDPIYKYYNRIYPSPELQINWLDPNKKKR